MATKLTDKQRAFVYEYPKDFNATQAAIRAGYSEKTAKQMGHENLTKPYLLDSIEEEFRKRVISLDEVLFRLSAQARGEFPTKSVEKDDGAIEKQYDVISALQLLGRYYRLFTDRVQIQDWRSEVIRLLYEGVVTPDQVREELGTDLAEELFKSAGISVTQSSEAEEISSEDN